MTSTRGDAETMGIEEAGAKLGFGRDKMYRMAREGKLPGVIRMGRTVRISKTAVAAMLAGGWNADGTAPEGPVPRAPARRGRPPRPQVIRS